MERPLQGVFLFTSILCRELRLFSMDIWHAEVHYRLGIYRKRVRIANKAAFSNRASRTVSNKYNFNRADSMER